MSDLLRIDSMAEFKGLRRAANRIERLEADLRDAKVEAHYAADRIEGLEALLRAGTCGRRDCVHRPAKTASEFCAPWCELRYSALAGESDE